MPQSDTFSLFLVEYYCRVDYKIWAFGGNLRHKRATQTEEIHLMRMMLAIPDPAEVAMAPTTERSSLNGATALRALLGLGALFVVAAAAGYLLQDPIRSLGEMAVSRFGLEGMAIAVLLIDSLPTPFSYVPVMLLGIEGGLSVVQVFVVSGTASFLAGLLGYGLGRLMGVPARLDAWLTTARDVGAEV